MGISKFGRNLLVSALFLQLIFVPLYSKALADGPSPVILQPGPGLNDGTDQGGLTSGKDASAYQGDGSSYAGNASLFALPISNCNETGARVYIQFDVSSLPAVADKAYVGFTHTPHTSYCLSHCSASWYIYPVLSDWSETTVSYFSPPSVGSAVYGPINISFPNDFGTREYEITSIYNSWKSGAVTNRGLAIYSTNVGCNNAAVGFYTHSSDATGEDAAKRPYLKVIPLNTESVPPFFSVHPVVSPDSMLRGTPNVNLAATCSDADSNITGAEYHVGVEGAPGSGTPMAAADGSFNSKTEAVTALINSIAWEMDTIIYSRCKDAANNWGPVSAAKVTVEVNTPKHLRITGESAGGPCFIKTTGQ